MQDRFDTGEPWRLEEERDIANQEAAKAPIDVWQKVNELRRANKGWVVIEDANPEALEKLIKSRFWYVVMVTEAPVKLLWGDRRFILPSGLTINELKDLICRMRKSQTK